MAQLGSIRHGLSNILQFILRAKLMQQTEVPAQSSSTKLTHQKKDPCLQNRQLCAKLAHPALQFVSIELSLLEHSNIPACTSLPYARAKFTGTAFHTPSPSAWLMNRAFVNESATMIVPFAPPSEDQVTDGVPRGFKPEEVMISRTGSVPKFSGDMAILKLTRLSPLVAFFDDSNAMMYCLFGS